MRTTDHIPSPEPRAKAGLHCIDAASLSPSCGLACFVDVETTGLSPEDDEVLELALLLFAFDRTTGQIQGLLDEYVGLREPRKRIPPEATSIHGITHETVRGKALDLARCSTILERSEFLVAHNAEFDCGFMKRIFPECRRKPWLCSMNGINWKAKGFPSRGLQALLQAHDIRVKRAHRGDADAAAALLLLSQRSGDGHYYFSELLSSGQVPTISAALPLPRKKLLRAGGCGWISFLAVLCAVLPVAVLLVVYLVRSR